MKLFLPLLLAVMLASAAPAAIVINEFDLANNQIELVNTGSSSEDISSWWWCNRVNGSPFYGLVGSTGSINVGLSSASSFSSFGAGETLVVDLTNGFLPDTNGELGLYNTNSFGSASAIEDYVLWGASGIRDIVAANAGIWTDDQSIDISSLGAGQTVQLGVGLPGNGAADYLIGTSTLGASNVPEPSRVFLTMMGAMAFFLRRRR